MNDIALATSMIEAEARDQIGMADTVEEKLKAAFSVADQHWMFTDENTQFSGAIGAVLIGLDSGSEDYRRIEKELKLFRALNAASSGVPVSFESLLEESEELEPVRLQKLWSER